MDDKKFEIKKSSLRVGGGVTAAARVSASARGQ